MRVVLALGLLAGCHKLFGLTDITSEPRDGAAMDGDAPIVLPDMPIDAKPCPPSIVHDEDSDSLDDSCDACPTIASNPAIDTDGDGLSDPCDADHDPGAHYIAASWMFVTNADFMDFTYASLQHQIADNGRFYINGSGVMRTVLSYTPTKIELKLRDVASGTMATFSILQGSAICNVTGVDCAGNDPNLTCLDLQGSNPGSTGPVHNQALAMVMFYKNSLLQCRIEGQGGTMTVVTESAPVPLPTTTLQLNTSATGYALIRSIVIYAKKP